MNQKKFKNKVFGNWKMLAGLTAAFFVLVVVTNFIFVFSGANSFLQTNTESTMTSALTSLTSSLSPAGLNSNNSNTDWDDDAGWWNRSRNFTLEKIGDRMVSGDFNGDGITDVATFKDYGNSKARIHTWLTTPDGQFIYDKAGWWDTTNGEKYDLKNIGNRMAAGDFNGDGKDDIAAFYAGEEGDSDIHIWLSTGKAFKYSGSWREEKKYWIKNADNRMVTGDFDGDGKDDIATFYAYTNTDQVDIDIWLSTGKAFQSYSTWWTIKRGYDLDYVDSRMIAGDFDGDKKDDIAAFYEYENGKARIHTWLSTGRKLEYSGSSGWWGVSRGYALDNVGGRIVSGDFNGDGNDDVATLFDYSRFGDDGAARIHTWLSTGKKLDYTGSSGWWRQESDYDLEMVKGRMVAGDFTNSGVDGIATFYGEKGAARIDVFASFKGCGYSEKYCFTSFQPNDRDVWSYGRHCGLNQESDLPPIDIIDQACEVHDEQLWKIDKNDDNDCSNDFGLIETMVELNENSIAYGMDDDMKIASYQIITLFSHIVFYKDTVVGSVRDSYSVVSDFIENVVSGNDVSDYKYEGEYVTCNPRLAIDFFDEYAYQLQLNP